MAYQVGSVQRVREGNVDGVGRLRDLVGLRRALLEGGSGVACGHLSQRLERLGLLAARRAEIRELCFVSGTQLRQLRLLG